MPSPRAALAVVLLALASPARAADHPIGGDKLLLRDAMDASRRKVRFRAAADPAVDPAAAGDPRTLGATLELTGGAPGDGATGPLALAAAQWTGLGRPAGSRGYKFFDLGQATGVRKAFFKSGKTGGTLTVSGGRGNWPYAVTQAQGAIDVRFAIGADVHCARFTSYDVNVPGRVVAHFAPAPAACAPPPTTTTTTTLPGTCGNGTAEGSEECDDGNTTGGDGCSATCQLESTSALCAGVPAVAGTALDAVRVASGLFQPTYVTAPRLDPRRVFVTEQNGHVRIIEDGVLQPTPFLDIHDEVSCCGEQGLLSIAFHPDFETNRRFFVSYTAPATGSSGCGPRGAGANVVAAYQASAVDPDIADESTRTVLLTIPQPFANHNGGLVTFGREPDGFLYFGVGDGGGGGDTCGTAQNDTEALGKILRIDVDNPPASPVDAVWAKGLRNPWRFSFDRGTGDLYVADVGQNLYEEVDVVPAPLASGLNYGWNVFEARHCFQPPSGCALPGAVVPVIEYCHTASDPTCASHPMGCSVTGGFVYRGCAMPDLRGTYFYSDYCSAFIRTFQGVSSGNAQNVTDRTADVSPAIGGFTIGQVTSFGEDARGELYVADQGGEVFKLVPGS